MSFEMPQKVLFRHCDPAGIVFFPRYFEMMNDCVEAFFDRIGHPFETLHKSGAVPTAEIETRFLRPSRHGDALILSLRIAHLGRTSLRLSIDTACGPEARMTYRARLVHVGPAMTPAPWPAPLHAALSAHIEHED